MKCGQVYEVMTSKPSEDVDQSIRQWMKARGWEVTCTNYDFDREIYAWRLGAGLPLPCGSAGVSWRIILPLLSYTTWTSSRSLERSGHAPRLSWL